MRKGQVNKFSEFKLEFNAREDKEYKIEAIKVNTVYNKEVEGQLPGFYYLVS